MNSSKANYIITDNGFIFRPCYNLTFQKEEVKETTGPTGTVNITRSIYILKEFEDLISDYNHKNIDVYDISVLYRILSIYHKLFQHQLVSEWFKAQYRLTNVGMMKDLFLKELYDILNASNYNGTSIENTNIFSIGINLPGGITDSSYVRDLVYGQEKLLLSITDTDEQVSPTYIIHRLLGILSVIIGKRDN